LTNPSEIGWSEDHYIKFFEQYRGETCTALCLIDKQRKKRIIDFKK